MQISIICYVVLVFDVFCSSYMDKWDWSSLFVVLVCDVGADRLVETV